MVLELDREMGPILVPFNRDLNSIKGSFIDRSNGHRMFSPKNSKSLGGGGSYPFGMPLQVSGITRERQRQQQQQPPQKKEQKTKKKGR